MKEIKFKCWLEDEGEKFYGPGPHELLKQIDKEGSISKAAAQMHMSYKKAWEIVQRLNCHFEQPLVFLKKGGQHGGGAEITSEARAAIKEYEILEREMQKLLSRQEKSMRVLK